ncbi:N-acetyl-gamma-glutamyl-phosphate reductase [Xenorhabdus thuongxuanensis]|uniref:N-acetyl-gamma-glutamyl-phosphate reductase n=1 Tax=Xenorhabdus thuongxuanensis TaxID=1873484 RepID=A0A1Q5U5R8_9GAMM|nr:N-acetyl-gamma-glutamyl-phosphate reductase [Xenorhabdus thuongxuanensis]OKP07821.1 N-acetyl-gamma-glutamyl-phosphate reductase [Xenorhabdus thuongxuanensis]
MKITVFVIGATGWTGCEVIRLLTSHPYVKEIYPISREMNIDLESLHPNLIGIAKKTYTLEEIQHVEPDVIFLCLPSGESHAVALSFSHTNAKIIDLGADFRFTDPAHFEEIYGRPHGAKELQKKFTYGYIEEYREIIKKSHYIANPGCYVNAALCGLIPLIKENIINTDTIFISAVNGTSGAGSSYKKELLHYNQFGNMLAYSLNGHRHTDEIENIIKETTGKLANISLITSHGNFARGIFMVQAMKLNTEIRYDRFQILKYLQTYYQANQFVSIIGLNQGSQGIEKDYSIYPQLAKVIGSNSCHISIDIVPKTRELRIVSVIDNLVKGAAGTAIQNMNLMLNIKESTGLTRYGL